MNDLIQTVLIFALPVVFAITLYEAARGYTARHFGDTTGQAAGRLSLNPMVHIDPLGTIVIPVVLYLATNGAFLFGYAKPMPINYSQLRNPKKDLAWVSISGPLANFIMAFAWALLAILLRVLRVDESFFIQMASAGVLTNLAMFAFHLIPVPPLAGGQLMISLLPHQMAMKFAQIEPYGFFIVMGLAILKMLQYWMVPVMALGSALLQILLIPFTFLF
ncbi:site-2 protease family protein [Undibacterium sp. CY7W]|uniref:Site-2 protease family protein n=1 Tax=Undibacterium rugosum TaxID=2762291 RepID=A0A923KZM2_9BURK|nr:site-2 protease family protein [Undibacterium rugosum]MBC3935346.1 site-2 protease family protein [Undibacterium rugosum]